MCVCPEKCMQDRREQKRRAPLITHSSPQTLLYPHKPMKGKSYFQHFRTAKVTINLGTNHWHYLLNPVIGLRATLGLTLIYNLSHIPPAPTRCLLPLPTGKVLCPPQERNLGAHLHKGDSLCSSHTRPSLS